MVLYPPAADTRDGINPSKNIAVAAGCRTNADALMSNTNMLKGNNEKFKKIRHAGRVHVRGMIRRVWRPRYLELDDDGVLCYYEAASSTSTHSNNEMMSNALALNSNHKKAKRRSSGKFSLGRSTNGKTPIISNILRKTNARTGQDGNDEEDEDNKKDCNINGEGTLSREMQAFSLPPSIMLSPKMVEDNPSSILNTATSSLVAEKNLSSSVSTPATDPVAGSHQTSLTKNMVTGKIEVNDKADLERSDQNESGKKSPLLLTETLPSDLTYGSGSDNDDEPGIVITHKTYMSQMSKNVNRKSLLTTRTSTQSSKNRSQKSSCEVERIESWDRMSDKSSNTNSSSVSIAHTKDMLQTQHSSDACKDSCSSSQQELALSSSPQPFNSSNNNQDSKASDSLKSVQSQPISLSSSSSTLTAITSSDLPACNASLGQSASTENENNQLQPPKQNDQNDHVQRIISQNLHHHIHAHRPKAVMAILSARIIDTTTLRDMHVGLPKGRFGFVFRGRPLFSNRLDNDLYAATYGLEGTYQNSLQQQLQQQQEQQQMIMRDDRCHPISIKTSDNDYFATSRHYLCAVSTLEEAQSWVVALQWAANVAATRLNRQRRKQLEIMFREGEGHGFCSSSSGDNSCGDYNDFYSNDCDDDFSHEGSADHQGGLTMLTPPRKRPLGGFIGSGSMTAAMKKNPLFEDFAVDDDSLYLGTSSAASIDSFVSMDGGNDLLEPFPKGTSKRSAASVADVRTAEGIVVVTKVRRFQIVQVATRRLLGQECETFYEINMLLLRSSHLARSTKRKKRLHQQGRTEESFRNNTDEDDHSEVEEQTIFRTYRELANLVDGLIRENLNDNSNSDLIQKLREFQNRLKGGPDTSSKEVTFPNVFLFHKQVELSVKMVDEIMRGLFLATNGQVCNSPLMRNYLCLLESDIQSKISDKRKKSSPSIFKQLKDPEKKILKIKSIESTDDFVKKWLSDSPRINDGFYDRAETCLLLCLQKPWIEALLTLKLIFIVNQIFKRWLTYFVYSVSIRIDLFLVIMSGTFYFGYKLGLSANDDKNITSSELQNLPSEKKHTLHGTKASSFKRENFSFKSKKYTNETEETILEENTTEDELIGENTDDILASDGLILSSPLPQYPCNGGLSCWSKPKDDIFRVRGKTYLQDRVKMASAPAPFKCRGVDIWLTDNPERHIARHPSVLGGRLAEEDTFVVNFLLPFANFVAYFSIPSISEMPENVGKVWTKFIEGNQQYRDARLKLLPVVIDGPWIVRKAVGPGTGPALLGKVIPLQYYFTNPNDKRRGLYEVDVIITASRIAKGILNVVKGHTKHLTIAFAFIIEAIKEEELPETVLCSFQVHSLHLEHCPQLPEYNLDESNEV